MALKHMLFFSIWMSCNMEQKHRGFHGVSSGAFIAASMAADVQILNLLPATLAWFFTKNAFQARKTTNKTPWKRIMETKNNCIRTYVLSEFFFPHLPQKLEKMLDIANRKRGVFFFFGPGDDFLDSAFPPSALGADWGLLCQYHRDRPLVLFMCVIYMLHTNLT